MGSASSHQIVTTLCVDLPAGLDVDAANHGGFVSPWVHGHAMNAPRPAATLAETSDGSALPAPAGVSLPGAVRDAVEAGESEAARLQELVTDARDKIGRLAMAVAAPRRGPTSDISLAFEELARSAGDQVEDHFARQTGVLRTFNIALFGRTGVGKSSLLSALAELDGSRVSRGESDWTVDVEPVPWGEGCRIYDTPGINGWGRTRSRASLETTARRAVEVADVVLLCFDSQSQQAIEFKKVAKWVLCIDVRLHMRSDGGVHPLA